MASTVKCSSCGWSWNKSDSSKKDMYVCHQCGKDNSMKHGGWLDAYDDVPQAQKGRLTSESTALPRNLDPRMKASVEEDSKRAKNIIAEKTRRENQGVIKNTKPFEVKDTRHWQSDSRAKERSNNPNVDFSLGVLADTFIDQIPYLAITNASEAFNSGQPLMGMSELLKQPYGPTGDALINSFQENPSNIDIKTLEGKVFGNSDISKKQNTKLSKAEQFIANDPYFFAEETDPSFIKSLDRPFTHLRNLGAKVAFDRDPKALLNLLAIGAIGSRKNGGAVESYMGGLTDQGFNYNGAWGGTMQMGGNIDSVLNANKNLDWVQRLYEENTPSIKIPKQKGRSTHFMESGDGRVYPTVVRMPNGKLKYLGDKAYDYADSTKTYIQFPSDEEAQQFSKDYKKGTNVLKNFQMGGNLPGAVGFTYARTKGIPSEGKYAKKTLPSAEEGMEILPDPEDPDRKYKLSAVVQSAKEILNPILRSKNPAVYDKWEADRVAALRKNAVKDYDEANPLSIYLSPEEVKAELSKQRKGYYEDYIGALKGISEYDLGKESYVGQKESNQPIEGLNYGSRFATARVNLGKVQEGGEKFRYSYIPKTEEYRKENFQNGGKMMSFYQHGLDWTPRNISRNGSEIKKDDMGYWNPDNWGEPVEIGSNEITMDGVYEPLMGVSDEGDVQMMYPGEDYKFKGKKVTEYPVKKNGGWLDKY